MAQQQQAHNPALAGRPPFATDDDHNEIYSTPPAPQHRRVRQNPEPNPNNRTSAYNMYDQYLDDDSKRHSGAGALGMGFMNGDMDSDDDDDDDDDQPNQHAHNKHSALAAATHPQTQTQSAIPLASPRPGYAAPIAALNLSRPSPAATPEVRQQQQQALPPSQPQSQPQIQMPQAQRQIPMHMAQAQRQIQMPGSQPSPEMFQLPQPFLRTGSGAGGPPTSPRGPPLRLYTSSPASSVPSTPHPLEAPITPITPAFLRPSRSPAPGSDNVKFVNTPTIIMRSNSEDHLLPKRGDKGDDFWRRFSMVAKEENIRGKESTWLQKTQNGTNRMSRWIWVIGMFLAICIAGGIGVGWYFAHNSPPNQQPVAIGGSADEGLSTSATTTSSLKGHASSVSSSPHVTPTNTVARRAAYPYPEPTPVGVPIQLVHAGSGSPFVGRAHLAPVRKRLSSHVNRIPHGY